MNFKYSSEPIKNFSGGAIVCFVPEFDRISDKLLKEIDIASAGAVTSLLSSEEFTGKSNEIAVIYRPAGFRADRIILVGVGDGKKVNADSFRRATGTVSRHKSLTSAKKAVFFLGRFDKDEYAQAIAEGYLLGSFKLLEYKSGENKKSKNKLTEITFGFDNARVSARVEKAVERGRIIADGQLLVRRLSATPSNYLTPTMFANEAQKLARENRLKCQILDENAIQKEKMGALWSVAKGSIEPPRFIILEYKGAADNRRPIVLVGKGVTFDTGGISLKQAADMHEMKGDMTGAAVVISTIITASRLKLKQNIVALVPSVENMPSGTATKPGDICVSRKGLTIENINTDAEGRLILADALDYANKFKPQAVIDIATLTGATLYILGYSGAPILGNNDKLKNMLKEASTTTAERVWELPIWDDHREQMKSSIADLVNSGGRPAGTIAAAAFLENFIGEWPWAHIDIAYVDLEYSGKPYTPKGPSGFGLRLLVQTLSNWKKL